MTDKLSLALIEGPMSFRPETRTVDGFDFTLGRGTDTNWTLADPDRNVLSRRHCQLSIEEGDWWVTDLSGNGTFINVEAEPVGENNRRRLRDGDRIRIGSYVFQIQIAPAARATPVTGGSWTNPPNTSTKDQLDAHPRGRADAPHSTREPRAPVPLVPSTPTPTRRGTASNPFEADDEIPTRSPSVPPVHKGAAASNPFDDAEDDGEGPVSSTSPTVPPASSQRHESGRVSIGGSGAHPFDGAEPAEVRPPERPTGEIRASPVVTPSWLDDDDPIPEHMEQSVLPVVPEPPEALPPMPVAISPATIAPAADPSSSAGASPLLEALLRGAGMPDARPKDPVQSMHALGEAFRAMVVGVRNVQRARRTIRGEFRIAQTTWTTNPLKVAVSDEDALEALLGAGRRSPMPPAKAVEEVLNEIVAHEMAIMAAMQQAIRSLLASLAPDRVREAAEQGGGLAIVKPHCAWMTRSRRMHPRRPRPRLLFRHPTADRSPSRSI